MIEPYPHAVVKIAITTVGSFISVMIRCARQTSHRDIILAAVMSLNINIPEIQDSSGGLSAP